MAKKQIKRSYKKQAPHERSETDRLADLAESKADRADAAAAMRRHQRKRELIAMLRAEREKQGLSLAQVGERIGMDRTNLHRLETHPNANPTIDTLQRIAHALGKRIEMRMVHEVDEAA